MSKLHSGPLIESEARDIDPSDQSRTACAPSALVFVEMVAVIRFPMKLL